jgi:hypothetical protein
LSTRTATVPVMKFAAPSMTFTVSGIKFTVPGVRSVGVGMLELKMSSPALLFLPGATGWSDELSRRFMWLRSRVRVATAELTG